MASKLKPSKKAQKSSLVVNEFRLQVPLVSMLRLVNKNKLLL